MGKLQKKVTPRLRRPNKRRQLPKANLVRTADGKTRLKDPDGDYRPKRKR